MFELVRLYQIVEGRPKFRSRTFIARDISALFGLKILNLHLRVQICQGELKDDKVKFERSNHLDKNKIYELKDSETR